MIFYFSGTGNSKWIASQLSKEQQEDLVFIPEALRNKQTEFLLKADEKIGFVFPVYSWAPPEIVLNFICSLTLIGYQEQYLFFICSCGDDVGLTQKVFEKALSAKGWRCNAGFSVTMPNSYVLLPGFDVDSKELEDKKLKNAVDSIEDINKWIWQKQQKFLCNKGAFPFVKTKIINPLFNHYKVSPRKFYSTDACVLCMLCEKSCPIENISLVEGRLIWGVNCTSCLACYHVCPRRAVQYSRRTKNKGRYFNPNV